VAEYLHDGVQLCAALGELGADRVAEAMGADRWYTKAGHQASLSARQAERDVEQVLELEQSTVSDEQVSRKSAGLFIGEPSLHAPIGSKRTDGIGSLFVERDHALGSCLPAGTRNLAVPSG